MLNSIGIGDAHTALQLDSMQSSLGLTPQVKPCKAIATTKLSEPNHFPFLNAKSPSISVPLFQRELSKPIDSIHRIISDSTILPYLTGAMLLTVPNTAYAITELELSIFHPALIAGVTFACLGLGSLCISYLDTPLPPPPLRVRHPLAQVAFENDCVHPALEPAFEFIKKYMHQLDPVYSIPADTRAGICTVETAYAELFSEFTANEQNPERIHKSMESFMQTWEEEQKSGRLPQYSPTLRSIDIPSKATLAILPKFQLKHDIHWQRLAGEVNAFVEKIDSLEQQTETTLKSTQLTLKFQNDLKKICMDLLQNTRENLAEITALLKKDASTDDFLEIGTQLSKLRSRLDESLEQWDKKRRDTAKYYKTFKDTQETAENLAWIIFPEKLENLRISSFKNPEIEKALSSMEDKLQEFIRLERDFSLKFKDWENDSTGKIEMNKNDSDALENAKSQIEDHLVKIMELQKKEKLSRIDRAIEPFRQSSTMIIQSAETLGKDLAELLPDLPFHQIEKYNAYNGLMNLTLLDQIRILSALSQALQRQAQRMVKGEMPDIAMIGQVATDIGSIASNIAKAVEEHTSLIGTDRFQTLTFSSQMLVLTRAIDSAISNYRADALQELLINAEFIAGNAGDSTTSSYAARLKYFWLISAHQIQDKNDVRATSLRDALFRGLFSPDQKIKSATRSFFRTQLIPYDMLTKADRRFLRDKIPDLFSSFTLKMEHEIEQHENSLATESLKKENETKEMNDQKIQAVQQSAFS